MSISLPAFLAVPLTFPAAFTIPFPRKKPDRFLHPVFLILVIIVSA